jgi:hypothetical protein
MEVIGIIISSLLTVLIVVLGFVVNRLDKTVDRIEQIKEKTIQNTTEINNIKHDYAKREWVVTNFVASRSNGEL